MTWRCDACGAYNDDSQQACVECKAERIAGLAPSKPPEPEKVETEASSPEPPIPEISLPEISYPEPAPLPEDISQEKEEPPPKEPEIPAQLVIPIPTPAPTPITIGQGRYYLVFVNTPAQSLIKSKVPIDFEDFSVISIGRSPENVVVIPDQEVSRKHAELTIDGSRLVLRDLKSKNGTYLYNGKAFEQVSDSVEVKPNSLVKFGTGTIVRITSE
jgi:hypothetical protein